MIDQRIITQTLSGRYGYRGGWSSRCGHGRRGRIRVQDRSRVRPRGGSGGYDARKDRGL